MPEDELRNELIDLDRRLTRIETLLIERNTKSDEMLSMITSMNAKIDGLQDKYVTRREFDEYKSGVRSTAAESKDGIKSWQAVVFAIVMLVVSSFVSFLMSK